MYTTNYLQPHMLAIAKLKFLLLAVRAYAGLLSLKMQVALMSLSLVSTQAPLISHSTFSVKLPFFKKLRQLSQFWTSFCDKPNGVRGHAHDNSWINQAMVGTGWAILTLTAWTRL